MIPQQTKTPIPRARVMMKHTGFINPLIGFLRAALPSGKTYGLWNWFKYSRTAKFVNLVV